MDTLTSTAPAETDALTRAAAPEPLETEPQEEAAAHYTAERRQRLAEMAGGPIRWREDSYRWIEGDEGAVDAFRQLLLRLDRYQDLLRMRRLCKAGGAYRDALTGLAALAHHYRRWVRQPETWRSTVQRNGLPQAIDQFGSLARHLVAEYDVPSFMDEVWFVEHGDEALRRQEWFIRMGQGGSVRELDFPIHLTRRMAHSFMQGRNRDSVDHNLRWAQVLGVGGDQELARTVLSTRLGRHLDCDAFWSTVVLFLATNPLIDPAQVGPLIDYVHNMRFAPRRVVREGGGVDEAPPPQPDFTMKGRSATKLLRQVDAWHGHLTRVQNVLFQSWQPSGLRPLELEDETPELGAVRWTVQELRSSWELAAEGTAMGHCVVSYSDQCADGHTSIWSIGLQREGGLQRDGASQRVGDEKRQGVLTVAVDPRTREVTQARGRHNMLPNQSPRSAQAQRAAQGGYLEMINRSEWVLQRWMERERLRRRD